MSQIIDALRRGRAARSALHVPRTAHGDAVLATLGYAPSGRDPEPRSLWGPALLAAGVMMAIWVGWTLHARGAGRPAAMPASASSSRPAASAPPARRVEPPAQVPPAPPSPSPVRIAPAAEPAGAVQPVPAAQTAGSRPAPPPAPAIDPVTAAQTLLLSRPGSPAPTVRAAPPAPARPSLPSGQAPARSSAAASARPPAAASPGAPDAAPDDLELALYYHRTGDFENALQHYRAVLAKNELDARAHNNLGLLYQSKNLLDESAHELQRALVIDPANAVAHNNYGVTLLQQGRADEALVEFDAALRLAPRSIDPLVNRALAQRDVGQPGLARETLLRALSIEPKNPSAHYNLAQLYDRTSETASAVEHYRKFLEFAPAGHAARAAVRARLEALTRQP